MPKIPLRRLIVISAFIAAGRALVKWLENTDSDYVNSTRPITKIQPIKAVLPPKKKCRNCGIVEGDAVPLYALSRNPEGTAKFSTEPDFCDTCVYGLLAEPEEDARG